MLTMRTIVRLGLSLSIVPLLVGSCISEKQDLRHEKGNEVVFGAATSYRNGEPTRTAYSGDFAVDSGTEYERID